MKIVMKSWADISLSAPVEWYTMLTGHCLTFNADPDFPTRTTWSCPAPTPFLDNILHRIDYSLLEREYLSRFSSGNAPPSSFDWKHTPTHQRQTFNSFIIIIIIIILHFKTIAANIRIPSANCNRSARRIIISLPSGSRVLCIPIVPSPWFRHVWSSTPL